MSATSAAPAVAIRRLTPADLDQVVAIDARHRGAPVPDYWAGVRSEFLSRSRDRFRVALGAEAAGRLVGFLLGESRAFEFGSEPCGWIFAVGVDPDRTRHGIASALLGEACRRFRDAGLPRVRTMVRRSDVPVLSFFRAHGFGAGEFAQLELDISPETP